MRKLFALQIGGVTDKYDVIVRSYRSRYTSLCLTENILLQASGILIIKIKYTIFILFNRYVPT